MEFQEEENEEESVEVLGLVKDPFINSTPQ
jgi:hypothetical protein